MASRPPVVLRANGSVLVLALVNLILADAIVWFAQGWPRLLANCRGCELGRAAAAPKGGVESMRVTSLVLAIVGGVVGIMFGLLAMAVGGVSEELEEGSGTTVIWLGVSAIAACVLGIVASGLHFGGKRRTLMSFVLLVAAVWHLVSISYFGIFGFLLLLLAAIFAWLSRKPSADEGQPGELVAAEAAGAPSADPSEDFRRLAQMKEEGLITAEEYDEKRRKLLEWL